MIECSPTIGGAGMSRLLEGFRAVCVALLAAALVSACGTTTADNASLAQRPLQASQARLKIYRTNEFMAAGPAARVKIDGREIANLGIGGSTILDVAAGSHNIVVETDGHPRVYAITLQTKPGMLYTLEVSPRSEAVMSGAVFGLVGMLAEASINENGGTFQVRVVDAKPSKG